MKKITKQQPEVRILFDNKIIKIPICENAIKKMFIEIQRVEGFNEFLKEEKNKNWKLLQESWKEIGALKERLRKAEQDKIDIIRESGIDRQNQLESLATWNVMDNTIDIADWVHTFIHRTNVCNEFLLQTERKERFIDPLSWPPVDKSADYQSYQSYYECN